MESRRLERTKQRFCCEIRDATGGHEGIVMNLTSDGLFILTQATIPPGTQVEIEIPATTDVPEMTLRAIVIRQRLVPDQSSRLFLQGLGLRVLQAPDAYYELEEREKTSQPAE
jgi:hypothetical protein